MSAAANTELTAHPRSPALPTFFDNLDSFADAPEGVAKLRAFVLDLAVRGKLVEQDENDESATGLVDAIASEKARLVKAKEIKKPRTLPPITNGAASTEVPTGWTLTQLGNLVFDFQNGLSKRRSTVGEPVPVLRLADIKSGEISSKELREIQLTDDELAQYPLVKGDVLIIRVNGSADLVGRFIPCRESKRWTYCDHFIRMRVPTDYVNQRFLCILANSRWGRDHVDDNTVTTAGQKTINQTGVGTLPVLLAPLSEQRRIVSKVDGLMWLCDELESRSQQRVRLRELASRSCLDSLVSSRSRRDLASAWQRLADHFEVLYDTPETLAQLRQSILQLAVQGKLVPQDPNDEPASDLSMEELVGRKNLKNGLSLKQTSGETPYRCLQLSALRDGVVDCSGGKPIPLTAERAEPYLIRKGDVFIVRGNGSKDLVGRAGIANSQPHNAIFPDLFIRTPLDTKRLLPRYFLIAWNSPEMRTQIERAAKTTSGIWKVNQGHIASMTLRVPPLAEQKRIVAKVDQLLSQCDELSARLRDRQSATHGLLTATIHQLLNDTQSRNA